MVAKRVVERLEVIQIDKEKSKLAARARAGVWKLAQPLKQPAAVGSPVRGS